MSQQDTPHAHQTVLFVCTGNFHRSRFAEHLFNALATEYGLSWRAVSRGTNVEGSRAFFRGRLLSPEAQLALDDLSVSFRDLLRDPLQLTDADFDAADLVIAVCEAEHRPQIEQGFWAAAERVQYWGVHDVPIVPAAEGLAALEGLVRELAARLRSDDWDRADQEDGATASRAATPATSG